MHSFLWKVSLLLFGSGFCALVYQMVWLRMLRLVFGSSTGASAAVLAIFMGGLGLGAWRLGRKADTTSSPLKLYAHLELGVSLFAAISPFLILFIRWCYIALGGSLALGQFWGTCLRLLLAAILLGIPTFLMGGTLPAAVRAVGTQMDLSRRRIGFIYGVNTLGAVAGAFCSTFFLVEILGLQRTLISAAILNVLIFWLAKILARKHQQKEQAEKQKTTSKELPEPDDSNEILEKSVDSKPATSCTKDEADPSTESKALLPMPLLLLASGIVGFAFLLMELVWYRMLAPILGGSSYTFGMILAVALLGIGLGSLFYTLRFQHRRPTLYAFVLTCVLEAFFLLLPFALGDRLALFVGYLRPLGDLRFPTLITIWFVTTAIVVLPAAILSGYQFPLLIALLGEGRTKVGQEVGITYAANTTGAILGSLLGGFGLFPLLGVLRVWKSTAFLLLILGGLCLFWAWQAEKKLFSAFVGIGLMVCTLFMGTMEGPTAVWRHRPIGAGRAKIPVKVPANLLKDKLRETKRSLTWEADGVESSVALRSWRGHSFYINGKNDGHSRMDAPTQVMLGIIGAALHNKPKRALVIGLGSGSTAGWLGKIPSIEQVGAVEFEPAIVEVVKRCSPVNYDVLNNPKVKIILADAREVLLTTRKKYDLIVSEPSNPYRAGISSLYTQEFYKAVSKKLRKGGIFVQWLQAYELSAQSIQRVYATLQSVFPFIETWEAQLNVDLLLIASKEEIEHNIPKIRQRLRTSPYREALQKVWGVEGAEGFYTGFFASHHFAKAMFQKAKGQFNTDDRSYIEFDFARQVGKIRDLNIENLKPQLPHFGFHRPKRIKGALNWPLVQKLRYVRSLGERHTIPNSYSIDTMLQKRLATYRAYIQHQIQEAASSWDFKRHQTYGIADKIMLAEIALNKAPKLSKHIIEQIKSSRIVDAMLLEAAWNVHANRIAKATELLVKAFVRARKDPWYAYYVMVRGIRLAGSISRHHPKHGKHLFKALEKPFAVHLQNNIRLLTRYDMAYRLAASELCMEVNLALEPHFPWRKELLKRRFHCYKSKQHPLLPKAKAELIQFLRQESIPIQKTLLPDKNKRSSHSQK